MHLALNAELMRKAFELLDAAMEAPARLKHLELVDRQLAHLIERRYPGAQKAADFFDDLRDDAGL